MTLYYGCQSGLAPVVLPVPPGKKAWSYAIQRTVAGPGPALRKLGYFPIIDPTASVSIRRHDHRFTVDYDSSSIDIGVFIESSPPSRLAWQRMIASFYPHSRAVQLVDGRSICALPAAQC